MDFGIIVDGAVIVLENVFRRLSEAREHHVTRKRPCSSAAVEVGRPTVFSMLIIIVAHIPIFTLQRHEGRIFAPMAYTVISALIGSLIFSLTLVPLLCSVTPGQAPRGGRELVVRCVQARVRAAAASGARAPAMGAGSCCRRAAREPGARPATGQRISAGAERRRDLGEHHAAARRFGVGDVAPAGAHPGGAAHDSGGAIPSSRRPDVPRTAPIPR